MAGRGGFTAVTASEVERLLAEPYPHRWYFAQEGLQAAFDAYMDKAWVTIHRAISDDTMYGTLGEPPLSMAVLGDHLIGRTDNDSFLYLKHPPEVADISGALDKLTKENFEEKLAIIEEVTDPDVERMGLSSVRTDMECVWPYFEDMRDFYRRAAAEGLSVLFSWG